MRKRDIGTAFMQKSLMSKKIVWGKMSLPEKKLFQIITKKSNQEFKKFAKYYKNDPKEFIDRIKRDYLLYNRFPELKGKFPTHILKMIKKIPRKKYDSAVCILRGAVPYALLFKLCGWKVHYVLCGRRRERIVKDFMKLRFNKNVDKTLKEIKEKKILIVENNSFSGNTPYRTLVELKRLYHIKKPDLFLDQLWYDKGKNLFLSNKKRVNSFGKIYEAYKLKVSDKERKKLVKEFLEKFK
jgi:hypothetical protein